ncbi:mucin-5AC-like [Athene noctua]|uniref:mucin-5AC-like n=1 Tax=Athene noctua TaxID=126797 RepID=UPI003EBA95E7
MGVTGWQHPGSTLHPHAGHLQLPGRQSTTATIQENGSEKFGVEQPHPLLRRGTTKKNDRLSTLKQLTEGQATLPQQGAQAEIQQETGSNYTEAAQQKQNISSKVNIIQPMLTNPIITPSNPAHNGRVCSTWGNFHFKTFDGDIFSFPGLCNYVFASHCNAAYEDFNIQIRRIVVENAPTISYITMKLEGVVAELTKDVIMINSNRVQLPYSQSGITIVKSSSYVKIVSKTDVVLMWNEDDSILLELNEKYANQTCGLCGDFNGFPVYNEFYSNNIKMTALQFGNMQKLDGPTEHCEDSTSTLPDNCTAHFDDICQKTLTSSAFAECNILVDVREYIMACEDDLCHSEESKNASCICDTFAEYSRQCAHAGGHPLNWRTSKLCPKKCPYNMQYQECSSPCADTCTNPERSQFCEEHCMDGCFCPPGTVFDDINNSGCIPRQQCSCVYNGNTYATGTSFSEQCHSCTCDGGQWSCQDMPCPGTCSVEGGSHISTYDKKHYDHHGDCTYILSKHCTDETFTILVELRRCGLTDTETCLKTVTLNMNKGQTLIEVKPDGGVFVNSIYTHLPISAANVTVFRPSSFFIIMQTNFGVHLEIQITPIMQVFVRLDPVFKDQTCGLCGNFNNIQTDDFKVISGIIEGTATAFANTWKTQASCPNIQQSFENPCALSIDNEKYAQHWCGLLTDSEGPFADCHYAVNPSVHHTNCMFDTCNCENSEDCLCAALSSYVRACAAKGVLLHGWRTDVCSKYTTSCPKSLSYSYTISSCQPTCRSLSEPDVTCNIKFVPVDGCACANGTYMDESGKCVPPNECPCYYRGSPIPFGEAIHENGLVCTCIQGRLNCIGAPNPTPACESPMVHFDCRNITAGTTGAECQKSCQTLDMQCYITQCIPGCVCPSGLVLDGNGGCIPEEECPCIHNEAMYQPGEKINVDCNTCVCKNRKWECTKDQCLGTCAVYGDGHYSTFDDKRFSFNGNCEYTLVQDHCGKSGTVNGTFRVITENIPCGNTGTTCSKSIKVFLESYELILGEEHVSVLKRGQDDEVPYTVRYMGVYLVIETTSGLILMWDKKTSIFIKLSPDFKGQVCGLCGNYDGNGINDFTTRSQSVVENVLEFGNSWKVSSTCPDAHSIKDPCSANPYRKSWSEKQCSIINSNVFAACHSQVEPAKYYQACVTDACACDTGGDCDCFCTAVAAYAQACSEVGVCVTWRTPSICPLFCDYYNQQGECEWHYKPCGASCMKTCRNPSGKCLHDLPGLEGCYPNCPPDKPYFHEDQMKCVSLCDCYDNEDGKIYRRDECHLCECTSDGLQCKYDDKACHCIYEGNSYKYGELIYNTTDGTGWCFSATCDVNGTINRDIFRCDFFTTTPFTFSTSQPTTTAPEITTATPVTTVCVKNVCAWSEWYDSTQPENKEDSGDYETFENLREKGYSVCKNPKSVQCRAKEYPDTEINNLNQTVQCSQSGGLICNNKDQQSKHCYNYEIRVSCCSYIPCTELKTTTAKTTEVFTTTTVKSTPFTIQTMLKTTTEKQVTEAQKTEVPKMLSTTVSGSTTPLAETSATIKTSQISTTGHQTMSTPPEKTTVAKETPTKPTTASTQTGVTTTAATTGVPTSTVLPTPGTTILSTTSRATTTETSPPPTKGTTVITPTPSVTTSAISTATTTTGSTTTSTTTSAPEETSTTATQTTAPTTTASTQTGETTTAATTGVPTSTAPPTPGTTILSTTSRAISTESSPPPTQTTTFSIPTTTTSAITAPASNTTDNCVPRCAWTQWFNLHSPSPGSENGDIETFAKIRDAGYALCDKPRDILCRAKDYPNRSLDQLGQVLECSLETGLVCRNKDQITKYPVCFDYEVSVECCDRRHCATTPAPPSTVATSTSTASTAKTSTLVTQTTAPTTTASTQTGVTTTAATSGVPTSTVLPTPGTTILSTTSRATTTTESSPPPTKGTTVITPTPSVTTSAISTATTTTGSTTTSTTTSAPEETSTTATQTTATTTTASTQTGETTTAATTGVPTSTAPPTPGTTILSTTSRATTTESSPPPTKGTTVITPTPSVTTSAISTATTTTGSTTTSTTTSAPEETSTTATQTTATTTTASTQTGETTTAATTGVPTSTAPPTPGTTILSTTSRATTTESSPPPAQTTTFSIPTTTTSTITAPASNTTDNCVPRCAWTQWFNLDSPSPGSENGDIETFAKIRDAGYALCDKPRDILCRAKDYPNRSLDQLGQVLECSLETGLVCRNKDQITKYPVCFDYEVSVECCDRRHCATTPAPPSTVATSTSTASTAKTSTLVTQTTAPPTTASTQTGVTTTAATSGVPTSTVLPTPGTTILSTTSRATTTTETSPPPTKGTTVITPTPSVTTSAISTATTTTGSTTTSTTTSAPEETSTIATQTTAPTTTASTQTGVTTTAATTGVPTSTAPPTRGTTILSTTSRAISTESSPPPTQTTTFSIPTTTTSAITAPASNTTDNCVPRCAWTQWFNLDSPSPGSENGDIETFAKIRDAGYALCDKPRDILCRAKDYPNRSLDQLGQVLECSLETGLVCRNKDQITKYPVCFDYEVRVECCDRRHCATTPAPPSTVATSTSTASTAKTSTLVTQTTAPTTTASTQTGVTTTAATSGVPTSTAPPTRGTTILSTTSRATTTETSPPPTKGTTVITPTPSVTTSAISTATTTTGSTTTSTTTSAPEETSTTATQTTAPTTTASTQTGVTTTAATTGVPTSTAPPTPGTTILSTTSRATTTESSPPPTQTTTFNIPTTTSTITAPASNTTDNCVPRCAWTQWFNLDSPSPGSENGDIETFAKIRDAGYALCDKPRDILCHAKDYPNRSLDQLGQVLECSLETGLVCRNKDQITKYPVCFDYEVRVECCDRRHCATTPAPPSTVATSTSTASTAKTSTLVTQTTAPPTTASTQTGVTTTAATTGVPTSTVLPTPGTTILSTTSRATTTTESSPPPTKGTTVITPTPSVTTSAISTATTTTGSTTTSTTTSAPEETSTIATQTTAPTTTASTQTGVTTTAATTGVPTSTAPPTRGTTILSTTSRAISTESSPPPTQTTTFSIPTTTTSAITAPASNTTDNCVPRCAWTQWFNLHSPSPGSENGDIETFAKIRDAGYALCDKPRDILCRAKDYPNRSLDQLGQVLECSLETGLVCRNKDQITKYPVCFDYEVSVECCDRRHCATTPAPPSTVATSTSTASTAKTSTLVTQTTAPTTTASTQTGVTTTAATTGVPTSTAPPTRGTTILSTTSRATTTETSPPPTKGTTVITPTPSVTTSAISTATTTTGSTTTSTTTSAPEETSTPATQTTAPTTASTLPQPRITSTISSTYTLPTSVSSTGQSTATTVFPTNSTTTVSPGEVVYNRTDMAGCNFYALCSSECEIHPFQGSCPVTTPFTSVATESTTQAASSTEHVFPSVSPTTATSLTTSVERNCTDVNPPRKPGEKWISECQECVCDPATANAQCHRLLCPTVQTPICDLGFVSTPVLPKDPCCPEYKCEPIDGTCVINGTMYTVGMSTVINSCKNCTCSSEKDPVTKANIVHCETVQCETSCPLGHQYMIEDGECCGKCIEVACKIKLSNGTIHVFPVDEILPLDNCSHYKCEKIEDQFVPVQTKKICPEYDPGECDPDEAETTPDGCCKICKPAKCKPYSKKTVIQQGDCESSQPVELTYCEGTCPGSSVYSLEANQMQHECSCCQEYSSQTREVTLTCQNGTSINYNYVYVEQCQCTNACTSETSTAYDSQRKIRSKR